MIVTVSEATNFFDLARRPKLLYLEASSYSLSALKCKRQTVVLRPDMCGYGT